MAAQQYSMFENDEASAEKAAAPAKNTSNTFTTLSISKTINGKQQAVFDHWLIPVFIGEWMFGRNVQAEEIVSLENTVRKNGEFNYKVKRRGTEISHQGEYLELSIPNKLSFSWIESTAADSVCQISAQFNEADGKTKLKVSIKIPDSLKANREKIKKIWTARCKALADKFK